MTTLEHTALRSAGSTGDTPQVRNRIAVLLNLVLFAGVVAAAVAVADAALVLATGSRALALWAFVLLGVQAVSFFGLVIALGVCTWLPRRLLCGVLLASLAVQAVVDQVKGAHLDALDVAERATILIFDTIVDWPASQALPVLLASLGLLLVWGMGVGFLRQRAGASGFLLSAEELASAERPGRPVFAILADTRQGAAAYLAKAFVIAILPTLAFASTLWVVLAATGENLPHSGLAEFLEYPFPVVFGFAVIAAPIIETLLLWLVLVAVRWLSGGRVLVTAAVVGAITGLAHLSNDWMNALAVSWTFFVQALVFMAWEKRSRWRALGMVVALHAANNFFVVVLIFGPDLFRIF